jgi:hypothetical protein
MIRRAIGTTLAGLCALTGPMAVSALADDADPAPAALTLSVSSVRPGVPFSAESLTNCPAEGGSQTVDFSFTDSAGDSSEIGSVQTDVSGSWSAASVQLPVNGVDASGGWLDSQVADGPGTVDAVCLAPDTSSDDSSTDPGDDSATDPGDDSATDPGDDSATDPGDDTGDPGDSGDSGDDAGDGSEGGVITLAYTSTLTVVGSAAQLSVSPAISDGGSSAVTVTPAEGCAGTGVADVELTILALGDEASDPLARATATTSASGTWNPVSIALPAAAVAGDYAVSADCLQDDAVTSSYDAAPLALGTVLIGAAVCNERGAGIRITGTYGSLIAGSDDGLSLPTTLKLAGDGPWQVQVRSDATGQLLATRAVTCARPRFDVDVPKTGVSKSGRVRARACNSGRAPVAAVLQILTGKRARTLDRETLQPGDCAWLEGGMLAKGKLAKAQVLLDPPGKGGANAEVAQKFSVRRGKH